jgi:osmotically-inducible protein OsmY
MNKKVCTTKALLLALSLAGALLAVPQASFAAQGGDDAGAVRDLQSKLNKSQFKNVKVSVQNGIVTLSGTVDLYEYKADADKRAHKEKGIQAVRNDIEVAGPSVSDEQLRAKLGEKLEYDRVGYGNVFDAISLRVENGVVTLGGHALDYPSRDSAIGLVSTYPGVKDVVDEIQVDPPSPMDDRIRIAEYRAIYGYPSLNRYAIDPAKTIRITVSGGHVELDGVVDSQGDKNVANIRANGVPGVFSVINNLQVANQPTEAQKQAAVQ